VKGEELSKGCCVGVHLRARFPPTVVGQPVREAYWELGRKEDGERSLS
jgi:hypothetical protein